MPSQQSTIAQGEIRHIPVQPGCSLHLCVAWGFLHNASVTSLPLKYTLLGVAVMTRDGLCGPAYTCCADEVDLDAAAVMFDAYGQVIDAVFYNQMQALGTIGLGYHLHPAPHAIRSTHQAPPYGP